MSIEATVIADSISTNGQRIITFHLRYPRFIHAEFLTHRQHSRNSSSSRAIPMRKFVKDIRNDPATFVHWGKNQPGMSAQEELSGWRLYATKKIWLTGMWVSTFLANLADRVGAHKQIGNRIIEPYCHMSTVMTATDLSNFYALRRHPDAQPEIRALADAMYVAQNSSTPVLLNEGEWHLPFITEEDRQQAKSAPAISIRAMEDDLKTKFAISDELIALIGVSVARCARTSYSLHNGAATTYDKDFALYQRLLGSVPIHASPAEHIATPDPSNKFQNLHGNFSGYVQYRKMLPGECQ